MSDGLKTGLIFAAAGVVAFLVYERSSSAAGVPSIPGTGSNWATSPGAAPSPASVPAGGSSVIKSVAKYAVVATVAPFYYPTKVGIAGAKYVGNAAETAFKDIFG